MIALVTGCCGLIGMESCRQFAQAGYDIIGLDNDLRASFFGAEASTIHNVESLRRDIPGFNFKKCDIRDRDWIERLFAVHEPDVIIHTAAQPSHDWAARDPHTDFGVNAVGTLTLLQAARECCPDSPFVQISTSKVYGDNPNRLPLICTETRYDLPADHRYYDGIDTSMSVDNCLHSLFGASKLAGDVLAQEYGRYFGMPTPILRPGCLTGGGHAGTEMHGFLSYLVRACVSRRPYTVYGYRGFQVRCNIHSSDLVRAFLAFVDKPSCGTVYNIGGGRENSISMQEAISLVEFVTGETLEYTFDDTPRIGDHMYWVSSNAAFERDYPEWGQQHSLESMVREIYETNVEKWIGERV